MNLRPIRLTALVLVTASLVTAGLSTGAGASPIGDKKAQADQLQREVDAQAEKIGVLGEQIHEAELKLQDAESDIATAEAGLRKAKADDARLRSIMRERAVTIYKTGGADTGDFLAPGSLREYATRSKYGEAAAQKDDTILNELIDAQDKLAKQEADARSAREAAAKEQSDLSAMRSSFTAQEASLQRKLDGTNAELRALMAADQRRRDAEALAKAQAQAAAAASARSTRSSGGSAPTGVSRDVGTAPGFVPAPSPRVAAVIAFAVAQLGKPYRYAGAGPDTWDCSGLTMVAWAQAGVSMPHGAIAQGQMFPRVSQADAQPGDLVVFRGGEHIGIYVGNGTMIHAPHTGDVVRYAPAFRRDMTAIVRPG